jgi:hypothetical protein
MQDPFGDCELICNTSTVCNQYHHCVLKQKPSCQCDYTIGQCIIPSSTTPTMILPFETKSQQHQKQYCQKEQLLFLENDEIIRIHFSFTVVCVICAFLSIILYLKKGQKQKLKKIK